jgi:hypothetical protein
MNNYFGVCSASDTSASATIDTTTPTNGTATNGTATVQDYNISSNSGNNRYITNRDTNNGQHWATQ